MRRWIEPERLEELEAGVRAGVTFEGGLDDLVATARAYHDLAAALEWIETSPHGITMRANWPGHAPWWAVCSAPMQIHAEGPTIEDAVHELKLRLRAVPG